MAKVAKPKMRWEYSFPLRYGPFTVTLAGLALVAFGLFAERPVPVVIAALTLGVLCVICAALLPRLSGNFEMSATGLRAEVLRADGLEAKYAVYGPATFEAEQAVDSKFETQAPNATLSTIADAAKEQNWNLDTTPEGTFVLSSPNGGRTLMFPMAPASTASLSLLDAARQAGIRIPG